MREVDRVALEPGGVRQQLAQATRQVLPALELAALGLELQLLDDLRRGGRADVGVDERLLEVLERLVVERLEDGRLQLGAERLARLRHVLAQPSEEAAALGLGVRVGGRRRGVLAGQEELVPSAGHSAREHRRAWDPPCPADLTGAAPQASLIAGPGSDLGGVTCGESCWSSERLCSWA